MPAGSDAEPPYDPGDDPAFPELSNPGDTARRDITPLPSVAAGPRVLPGGADRLPPQLALRRALIAVLSVCLAIAILLLLWGQPPPKAPGPLPVRVGPQVAPTGSP